MQKKIMVLKLKILPRNGVGIDIHGRSAYIEVQHIFIHNKTYGFWVKQEGSCVDSLQFPNWIINNIYFMITRLSKMNQEGMYLGSTDPNGARDISCNGQNHSSKTSYD